MWTRTSYTRSRHLGFLFMLSFQGFLLFSTDTLNESGLLLLQLEKWLRKEEHKGGINGRQPPRGMFGQPDLDEWRVHFMSGLPGLGPERSANILSHFGRLPFELIGDLAEVPGIGKKTAERIKEIFDGE